MKNLIPEANNVLLIFLLYIGYALCVRVEKAKRDLDF